MGNSGQEITHFKGLDQKLRIDDDDILVQLPEKGENS